MKKLISALVILLFSTTCLADELKETSAAAAWLSVVDSGNYEKSWHQAAPFFQRQLSSEQWVQALSKVRAPLGELLSRQAQNTSRHSTLPGAPIGEYVVIIFATNFEQKQSATETITVSKVGAEWRVAGYFIN